MLILLLLSVVINIVCVYVIRQQNRRLDWGKGAKAHNKPLAHQPGELITPSNNGRVVKVTTMPEFTVEVDSHKGGRVIKTMPKQLREIKEGQEAPISVVHDLPE